MSTRDEIEQIRAIAVERQWPQVTMPIADFMAVSALSLRALDTEADARLGKAVRCLVDVADADDLLKAALTAESQGYHYVASVACAIAAALRAEVPR